MGFKVVDFSAGPDAKIELDAKAAMPSLRF